MHLREDRTRTQWKWGLLAAVFMTLLSLYPQVHFWVIRGSQWNGSYAVMEGVGDELAYSAYINALISGRPRRNDPYTGLDDRKEEAQPESLFSIQFVPAYLIALAARALGISASTAFIVLTPFAAFTSSLALFSLLAKATSDDCLAGAGTIFVLCLGTVAGGHGLFTMFLGQQPLYNYLIFLRRYQPAASFPFFLIYCLLVWKVATSRGIAAAAAATGAGVAFGLLVFSYVYLWTAAVAWLVCLGLLWVAFRPPFWRDTLRWFALILACSSAVLIPFGILYSHRSTTMDSIQALEHTYRPDLFRLPEMISAVILITLIFLARRRVIDGRRWEVPFAASFALLPIAVFNQQVITGQSLQPLHYEMFVASYSVLIALVLAVAVVGRIPGRSRLKISRKAIAWIAIASFEWGAYETLVATRGSMESGRRLDEARPVALRLEELRRAEPQNQTDSTVLSSDLFIADGLPTVAPQAVLWAPHMLVFSGTTLADSKERFYQYLYYTGVGAERLKQILTTERSYGVAAGLFGFERTIKGLSVQVKPIMEEDLEAELSRYSEYCASFTRERAARITLSYLIMPTDQPADLSNFDRWYHRDAGEQISKYTLYRVNLREEATSSTASIRRARQIAKL